MCGRLQRLSRVIHAPCLARLRLCKAWNVVALNASQWLALNAFSGTGCGHTWPQSFEQVSRRHTTWNIYHDTAKIKLLHPTTVDHRKDTSRPCLQSAIFCMTTFVIIKKLALGISATLQSTGHVHAQGHAPWGPFLATHTCWFTGFVFSRINQQIFGKPG